VKHLITATVATLLAASVAAADVSRIVINDGSLVMEDIPPIPRSVVNDLNRYQNVRFASFLDWSEDGRGIYVSTRFGEVNQVHYVGHPGGARRQLTFFDEPISGLQRQPGASRAVFTMDAGGSEFSQIFLFEPGSSDDTAMLTDGKSRNGPVVWSRDGGRIAYQSTRRNGAANDIWMMDVDKPESAEIVLESPDGTNCSATDFSPDNGRLLVSNYAGNMDSRVHLLDLGSGQHRRVAGDPDSPSSNFPVAFDRDGAGFWLVTDIGGDFRQLAWQSLEAGAEPVIVTGDIPWDIEDAAVSDDRSRLAFVVNADGLSELYLLDPATRRFVPVKGLPSGLVGNLRFSPDGRRLGITLNTPQTPSDSFVLDLGGSPLEYGELVRWSWSEVGGLDTEQFIEPELVRYATFDSAAGGPASIPAWVYKPRGPGPHPVIIAIHGGPEGQARPSFSSTNQLWLDKLGAAVIWPNVRGSSGYGKHNMSLDNGVKREESVKDIGALLDWIAAQPDLDASRVAVQGGSYGGYMVLASAVHYSDRLKAAVDVVSGT
jgi:dipeptidyl aminopeptidase/acylaminoacyl peptidase